MAYLLDTNILVRLANGVDPNFAVANQAVYELHRRGELLQTTPQNYIEFRNVATRPVALNGLGLSALEAEAKMARFEGSFPLLTDTPDIYPMWKAIVVGLGIVGMQVHDARLVAVCYAHRVSHLMTFNIAHFSRMAGFGPGVTVVDPAKV